MRKTVLSSQILGFLLLSHASMGAPEDEEVAAFEGTGDRHNEPFSVAGPWRLWSVIMQQLLQPPLCGQQSAPASRVP